MITWLLLASVTLGAEDKVKVSGTATVYPTKVNRKVEGREVELTLSGTAVRRKLVVNVYSIASYVAADSKATDADSLAAADEVKQLHLVLLREVDGAEVAENMTKMIDANHPGKFAAEVATLKKQISKEPIRKGDEVRFTHLPGKGLECEIAGRESFVIDNPAFSRAIWDIYLGPTNLGSNIKSGLTSRLR